MPRLPICCDALIPRIIQPPPPSYLTLIASTLPFADALSSSRSSRVTMQILEDEATPFTSSIWRAVVFESLASAEGFDSRDMVVE